LFFFLGGGGGCGVLWVGGGGGGGFCGGVPQFHGKEKGFQLVTGHWFLFLYFFSHSPGSWRVNQDVSHSTTNSCAKTSSGLQEFFLSMLMVPLLPHLCSLWDIGHLTTFCILLDTKSENIEMHKGSYRSNLTSLFEIWIYLACRLLCILILSPNSVLVSDGIQR